MIEINLLPGAAKKSSRRGMPKLGGGKMKLPEFDRTIGIMAAVAVLALAGITWLHFATTAKLSELSAEQEAAVRDSVRYDQLRTQGDSLRAQVATISQKLEVIQSIDAGRFIWPHIFDELSRALPPYVWLTAVREAASDAELPRIRVEGRAGNLFTLGRFMRELEASPFFRGARLISSEQVTMEERTLYEFVLEAEYEEPPPDVIQTVPLFEGADTIEQEDR